MSLTNQDLTAIKRLIDSSCHRLEVNLIARIDKLDETLSIQAANGLAELHDKFDGPGNKFDGIRQVVDRIDQVQQAELERNDRQDNDIKRIRKALHAA